MSNTSWGKTDLFKKSLLAITSGGSLGLIIFLPSLSLLIFFFLIPFLLAIENCHNKKEAFSLGFLLGLSYTFLASLALYPSSEFFTIIKNLKDYGYNNYSDFILFILLGFFITLISLVYGIFGFFNYLFLKNPQKTKLILFSLPALFVIIEFLKKKIIFDLSWLDLGYYLIDYKYLVLTSRIWGKYGLSFLIILINLLIYFLITKKSNFKLNLVILIIVIFFSYFLGYLLVRMDINNNKKIKIAILQGYVNQPEEILIKDEFYIPSPYNFLIKNLIKTNLRPDIILLPENVIHNPLLIDEAGFPVKISKIDDYFISEKREIISILKETGGKLFIIGQSLNLKDKSLANSFIIFDNKGDVGAYLKKRLFPFVEKEPLLIKLEPQPSSYQQGRVSPFFKIGDLNFLILSCIEIENDGLLNKYLKKEEPSIILTGGSETLFNQLAKNYQLILARFRAVEQNRYLAKATTNGFSAIIDPYGKVLLKSKNTKGNYILVKDVYLKKGKTIYSQIGELPFIFLYLLIFSLNFFKLKFKK